MPVTAVARRAESVLTWKWRRDAREPGARALGAVTAAFGRVEALRVPALRELTPYNKARGLGAGDLPELGAITEFFTGTGTAPAVEVWEGDAEERLHAALGAAGFTPGARTATLYRRPAAEPARGGGVVVTELPPDDPRPEYARTLAAGYGFTGEALLAMLAAEHAPGAVRRYLAHVDGRPAAAASLCVTPAGVLLGGAATLPAFRRRGCQAALIARRLADAAAVSDLAVVTVALGSPSHANLERAGFRPAHTRTVWVTRSRRSGG